MRLRDEHALKLGDRAIVLGGPLTTSLTLAWLASHRGRLRSLIFGGHRLSVLVVWDRKGRELVERSDEDVAALARVVYGPPSAAPASDEPVDLATCEIPDPRPLWR